MGGPVLRRGGAGAAAEGGFTLIEIMVAMAITIVMMLANLYLFSTAQKNLSFARSLTQATNLAGRRIDELKGMSIAQIEAAAPTLRPSPNPLQVREGSDVVAAEGMSYTRTWVVSQVDLDHASPPVPDLAGDVVKIRLEVAWRQANRDHQVTMTTFATGKPE